MFNKWIVLTIIFSTFMCTPPCPGQMWAAKYALKQSVPPGMRKTSGADVEKKFLSSLKTSTKFIKTSTESVKKARTVATQVADTKALISQTMKDPTTANFSSLTSKATETGLVKGLQQRATTAINRTLT